MIDPSNDADLLTLEFEEAANLAANGVCVMCTEALDPTAPKWAAYYAGRGEDPARVAEAIGPVSALGDRHEVCEQPIW